MKRLKAGLIVAIVIAFALAWMTLMLFVPHWGTTLITWVLPERGQWLLVAAIEVVIPLLLIGILVGWAMSERRNRSRRRG